jgi:hypothetical protein
VLEFARPTFEFRRPSFYSRAPPVLRELLDAFLAELPSLPSLPASISLPRASLSAVSLLDHASDGQEEAAEEGPTPEDALLRADFGRRLIGYEDLPLEWRNNLWVVGGYRCVCLLFLAFLFQSLSLSSLLAPSRLVGESHRHVVASLSDVPSRRAILISYSATAR